MTCIIEQLHAIGRYDLSGALTRERLELISQLRALTEERDALKAEVERLTGLIDDIESESGHSLLLDDSEHEPPHLSDWVRDGFRERSVLKAEVERLRSAAKAAKAVTP